MDNPAAPIPSVSSQTAVQSEVSTPSESSNRRWFLWLVGGLAILALGIALGFFSAKFLNQSTTQSQISSYEDCLTAKGSLVQMSYPATCVTASGQRFVQPLTDEEKQSLQPPDLYREPTGSAVTSDWETYISPNNYSIRYPKNWTITSSEAAEWQQEAGTPNFSVVSNKYKIIFSFPSGFGPGICIFSDQPDFTKSFPDNPIAEGSKCPGEFIEVKGEAFVFRRLSKPTPPPREGYSQEWSVYTKDNNGNFVTVPPINYDVPPKYDLIIIKEMDQILSTFKFLD